MDNDAGINLQQARSFLINELHYEPSDLALIGEGAWSRCFGFQQGTEALAIRFGNYVEDFQKDQSAYRYATPALPIPQVYAIGEAFDGYFAVSTQVQGVPLEQVSAAEWYELVPTVVAALEALRTADISETTGFGSWDGERNALDGSWSARLLAVDTDALTMRTHGWRAKLATLAEGEAAFAWGYDLLRQIARDDIPRSLLHCDLINRNVLVDGNRLSGVFDWGCSIYGDHLYELAWFEFWEPWLPAIDAGHLRQALEAHWHKIGYRPTNQAERLAACYLHIGLDHLAYNAYREDWPTLLATAAQMRALVKL